MSVAPPNAAPAPPGMIQPEQWREAERRAGDTGADLYEALGETLGVSREELPGILGRNLGLAVCDPAQLMAAECIWDRIPYPDLVARDCVLVRDGERLALVAGDPLRPGLREWADWRLDEPVAWYVGDLDEVRRQLATHEGSLRALDVVSLAGVEAEATQSGAQTLSVAGIHASASPAVRLVDSILYDAMIAGASDIHLETIADGMVVRYRIDGVLSGVHSVRGQTLAEQAVSRIKVMAELDIAERRVPQDGRFNVTVQGRQVDVRASVMPSVFGEDVVLRILDRQAVSRQMGSLRLESLGFDGQVLAGMRQLLAAPHGMLLVTGPTGSGKTTTLYAAIAEINSGLDKIVTIEDPVEYQLPGVVQIPVNEKKGLTFARGLRSILRHDPDKIMVGEIRDPDTAQIAVQASLTGHLVLTTVHANSAFDVIFRALHMGIEPYTLVSALNGVVAQRLVRLNCPHCSVEVAPDPVLLKGSGIESAADGIFRAGRGCPECRGSGYRGRRAVGELMTMTDELRDLIVARESRGRIMAAAVRAGMRSLREAGLDLVCEGRTTLQELNRVAFLGM